MTAAAGKRDHLIDVQQHNGRIVEGAATYSRDEDWDTILSGVPATCRGVTGGETVRGRQMDPTTTSLLEILYTPRTQQINSKMRLVMEGRVLNIVSAFDPDGKRREIMIQATERT